MDGLSDAAHGDEITLIGRIQKSAGE
jgi:hypothetical protein